MANSPKLKVVIKSKKTVHFSGPAESFSSKNDLGEFDVLYGHANFISIITGFVLVDKNLPTQKRIELEKGVVAVHRNNVEVFIDLNY